MGATADVRGDEPPRPPFAWAQSARHVGQLARSDAQWEVYVELAPLDGGFLKGRVHFVQGERHRETAWIFMDRTDRDILNRFNEFSAAELWQLMESLVP